MSYATIDDVTKRYPMVLNVIGSGNNQVASVDVSSIYIQDSESIINAYLNRRYVIPLATEPLLTWIAADISIYRLFEDRLPRFPDDVVKRYTNAISMLMGIQMGKMDLISSSAQITSGGDQDAWTTTMSNASNAIFAPAESITNTRTLYDPFIYTDRKSF